MGKLSSHQFWDYEKKSQMSIWIKEIRDVLESISCLASEGPDVEECKAILFQSILKEALRGIDIIDKRVMEVEEK